MMTTQGTPQAINWRDLPWEVRTRNGSRLFYATREDADETAAILNRLELGADVIPFVRDDDNRPDSGRD